MYLNVFNSKDLNFNILCHTEKYTLFCNETITYRNLLTPTEKTIFLHDSSEL